MPFIAPLVAAGGGLLAGISTFLQSGTIMATLVKFGLGLAANVAVSLLGNMLVSPPSSTVQMEASYGVEANRWVIMGTLADAGHHVYRNASGEGNRDISDVHVVSHFRISGITRYQHQDRWVDVPPELQLGYFPSYPSHLGLHFYQGTLGQAANAGLIATSNPGGKWTADHRLAGNAYVVSFNRLHHERWQRPREGVFEIKGAPLYDWRLDSSVGGSGPCRWDDQDTWVYTDNPVVMMYNLCRGIYVEGLLLVGRGMPAYRLPLDKWTVAANICDETIDGIPRYAAAIKAKSGTNATHKQNMDLLLAACAGSWFERALAYPIVGATQAVVATITDADLMIDEDFRYSQYRPTAQLINTIAASYLDPNNFYQSGDLAVRSYPAWIAADLQQLSTSLTFGAVTRHQIADRLVDIQFRANRYQANADICVNPKHLMVQPGMWVRWVSDRDGFDKTFQITGKRLGPVGPRSYRNIYWQLQEVGLGIFDPTEFLTDPLPPIYQGPAINQIELANFHIEAVYGFGVDTQTKIAIIALSWDAPVDSSVYRVDVIYWNMLDPGRVYSKSQGVAAGALTIHEGIKSNATYALQYNLVAAPARPPSWTVPVEVTALNAPETDIEVRLSSLGDDVLANQRWIAQQVRDIRAAQEALDANAAGSNVIQIANVASLRSEYGEGLATATELIMTLAGPESLLATKVTSLELEYGEVSAGARFAMSAAYTPAAGFDLRAGFELRINDGDPSLPVGFYMEAKSDGTRRILWDALQSVVLAGGVPVALFDPTGAFFNNALIVDLEAVNIKARSIYGDRIVVAGIDTPELQLNSVTYVDEETTSSTVATLTTGMGSKLATVAVVGYVSGGVGGGATVLWTIPASFAEGYQFVVSIYRSSAPDMSVSPVEVARNMYGYYAFASGGPAIPNTPISVSLADVPPGAGDWYYAVYARGGANATGSKIVTIHAKR